MKKSHALVDRICARRRCCTEEWVAGKERGERGERGGEGGGGRRGGGGGGGEEWVGVEVDG